VDAAALLEPLSAAPGRAALILDVDGTLAPIVARPELAEVPAAAKSELARLARRYALVACLSGRAGDDAARLVGVPEVETIGNHGLELLPDADALAAEVAAFRRTLADRWPIEDKGLTLSLHFREAADEQAARRTLTTIADEAERAGLDARWGRKVLELRPRVNADKGTAVRALLERSRARLGLYAGDDTTDLDAFRGLREAGLEWAVAIGVASPEAAAELLDAADLVVDGPAGVLALLRRL
jgi:trehalose 6-phosphate phosphatase